MFKVERDEKWWKIRDTARRLFYPLVPFIAVATVWSIAWARSLESQTDAATHSSADDDDPLPSRHRLTQMHDAGQPVQQIADSDTDRD